MKGETVYTVNVKGGMVSTAEIVGWHAYYANGVTAVEIQATSKQDAKRKAERVGLEVLYVFE